MMGYTCEICTDYIDPSKTEEILQRVTKIISDALYENAQKKAPLGTDIPSGAKQKSQK